MSQQRKEKILEIISTQFIETQEDLIAALKNSGFSVTQSTVSRDIKQLGIIKVLWANGRYRYAKSQHTGNTGLENADYDRLLDAFKRSVISVKYAMNDVVIKCYSGMAQGACVAFDSLFSDWFVGTLAGEDTIFAVTADEKAAAALAARLNEIMR